MLDKKVTVEKKKISVAVIAILLFLILILIAVIVLMLFRASGKKTLAGTVVNSEDPIEIEIAEETEGLKEGQIIYNDIVYQYNEDLVSILIMGIDKETVNEIGGQSWEEVEGSQFNGGQADGLFLLVLNPHTKKVDVVAINRNTMANIDVFDGYGRYEGIQLMQIALQHGFGDGKEQSCERQVKAVSRLLYNIPINAYAAISMDAIPDMNDAIGGVTLIAPDEIVYPEYNMDIHPGDEVTLMGEQAYWFLRLRYEYQEGSSDVRLNRQKIYLSKFLEKAKQESKSDIRVAINLYDVLKKYMVTTIGADSFTYIVTELIGYDFDPDSIYSLKGETVMGEKYEEFHVDEQALQELIIKLFYEPVK
ncbi:MAG: LCP family protein [Lachnospiraceae bacterium]|nr:LCP family protein [Lachnospiraceae bacterium]